MSEFDAVGLDTARIDTETATKRAIEFRQGESTIIVEVEDELSTRGTVEKARRSFEEAVAGIGPIAETIMRQMTSLGPETVEVEPGVKFDATAGVILASSAVEGNCRVALSWKPRAAG